MTIPSWTYSQLEKFETCPKQFYHVRVARDFSEPPTEHIKWGEVVHKAMEERVMNGTPLPEGMEHWESIASKLANLPGEKYAEYKMNIDKSFNKSSWREAWSRGIADLLVVDGKKAAVFDHKTGKRKVTEQIMLYAGYTFAEFPEVDEVTTVFVWLKEKKLDKEVFTRADVPKIWNEFLPRVIKLEKAYEMNKWPAKPSGLCTNYCAVLSCGYNGKKGR
jgi:hypothetical protein